MRIESNLTVAPFMLYWGQSSDTQKRSWLSSLPTTHIRCLALAPGGEHKKWGRAAAAVSLQGAYTKKKSELRTDRGLKKNKAV